MEMISDDSTSFPRFTLNSVTISAALASMVAIILGFIYLRRDRASEQLTERPSMEQPNTCETFMDSEGDNGPIEQQSPLINFSNGSANLAGLSNHLSYARMEAATNNFDEALILGEGGYGKVYKGELEFDGVRTHVAIKRWKDENCYRQGEKEFHHEMEKLSTVRHRNLVSLIGHCEENGQMMLVYEYMPNGTLRSHLYNTLKPSLSWKTRLRICVGAARGLHYLHTGAKNSIIIHRDVKSTNILVDGKWEGRISDFGLCKTGPPLDETTVSFSTEIEGTFGYLDPEYMTSEQLTKKSDVYSFGIVLLEVLCARAPFEEQILLSSWARKHYHKSQLYQKIDPRLRGEIATKSFKTFSEITMKCLAAKAADRPSMEEVVFQLVSAFKIQEEAEKDSCLRTTGRESIARSK